MMRILLDEMLPGSIATQLRKRGVDAEAVVLRPELLGASDADILSAAVADGRMLVTLNIGDFVALDRQWRADDRTHSGLILVSTRTFPLDARFVGAVTNALAKLARNGEPASPSALRFL